MPKLYKTLNFSIVTSNHDIKSAFYAKFDPEIPNKKSFARVV